MRFVEFVMPGGCVVVPGPEYRRMHELVVHSTLGILRPNECDARARLTPFLHGAEELETVEDSQWPRAFGRWLHGDLPGSGFEIDGETCSSKAFTTNTVLALGSPMLMFLATLIGSVEDFALVEEQDAGWFAETLERAISRRVLRHHGWRDVMAMAYAVTEGSRGPIVIAHPDGDYFPNSRLARWKRQPNSREQEFVDLREREQWRLAEIGLRASPATRHLTPAVLEQSIAPGLSAFDLPIC